MAGTKTDLLETFLKLGFIRPEAAQEVKSLAAKRGIPPLEAALLGDFLDGDAKGWLLAERLGLPYSAFDPKTVSMSLSELLPESLARERLVVPIARDEGRLTLAAADPFQQDIFSTVAEMTGMEVRVVVSPIASIEAILSRFYPETHPLVTEGMEGGTIDRLEAEAWNAQGGARRVVEKVLLHAVSVGLGSVQLSVAGRNVLIKGRGRKGSVVLLSFPLRHRMALLHAFAGLAGMAELPRDPTETVFQLESATGVSSFRISLLKGLSGPEAIVKMLPDLRAAITLDAIGFSSEQIGIARKVLAKGQGFHLISAPGPEGVATTLFALLRELCQPGRRVVTVEERHRFRTEGYIQMERRDVGERFGGRWKRLAEMLEPEALMIENIADPSAISDLIHVAQGGTTVLCGIRRFNFDRTLRTVLSLDVDPFILSNVTRMVMHQRLVNLLCLECRRPVPARPSLGMVGEKHRAKLAAIIEGASLYVPSGCPRCQGRGFSGKMALVELLPFTPAVQNLVSSEAWMEDKLELLLQEDFYSAVQSVHDLLLRGMVTYEDVLPFFR